MSRRHRDWIEQGKADLRHAQIATQAGTHEWSCFASQQAAEKAIKGLFIYLGGEGWGHSLTHLLQDLGQRLQPTEEIMAAARRLDKLYIPTRYPNGFDAGKPGDYYTAEDANVAIRDATLVIEWVEKQIS